MAKLRKRQMEELKAQLKEEILSVFSEEEAQRKILRELSSKRVTLEEELRACDTILNIHFWK